ncbi:MAG: inosine/xanthosine triphosphatase [Candidatus Pacebacteria bacterium CG10_big_fil_rev_8_21_14_0_10_56_10]|nr:MAG: inosine/xanthosine triphosphatase [Candidatus Pacebacteria bacterium CG10_big_fil_rev_8_21_14_0_10_56_10]
MQDVTRIFVGSDNPVKVNGVVNAASETWPEVVVTGLSVDSGVPAQPRSDEDTFQGALNRARAALEEGWRLQPVNDDGQVALGVGLEGGVYRRGDELWSTVWVAVLDQTGYSTAANGARFKVPQPVADQIEAGGEMGPIMAQLVGERDVRRKQGMIGVITQGFVDRTEEYASIAKMALGLWYGRGWDNGLVSAGGSATSKTPSPSNPAAHTP